MMWNSEYNISDAALGMNEANPAEDLRLVANDLPLSAVLDALAKIEEGRLIKGSYQAPGGRGCLLKFLTGVSSKAELLAFPFSEEAGWAARRLVRFHDYGQVSSEMAACVLRSHIAQRQEANVLEDRTVATLTNEAVTTSPVASLYS